MDGGHVSVGNDEAEERTLPPNYSDVFQGSNAQAWILQAHDMSQEARAILICIFYFFLVSSW
jgi:hypothetical protein